MLKRMAVILLSTLVMGIIGTAAAHANPYSYTRYHCIMFARAFQAERYNAAALQVRYLTQAKTLNSVERWADALYQNPSDRYFNGLVNGCYNVVVVNGTSG